MTENMRVLAIRTGGAISALLAVAIMAPAVAHAAAQNEMTDQSIADKIDDELFYDRGVPSSKIDAEAINGVVTLSGQVNNMLAKQRAARIAETVRGVRAVINEVEVTPSVLRSDAAIRQDVITALAQDPATESYEVTVTVDNGEVTLDGSVDSYQESELVKTVAKGVSGVKALEDKLRVTYDADRTDTELREEIQAALDWDVYIDAALIQVSVNGAEVTLTGTVGSAAEKTRAASEAWVAGVGSVDSSGLTVAKWARDEELRGDKYVAKSDSEIKDAIVDALVYDPRVLSTNVTVDVTGSTATLRGEVDSLAAKQAAEQDARNTVGVRYVYNRLKVRPATLLSDLEVSDRIDDAIERDPYLERFEISATVIDGTAYLYGTVDSWFEKNQAEDVASRVVGVLSVDNNLSVDNFDVYTYDAYVDETYIEPGFWAEYQQKAPLKSDSEIRESIKSELWWSPFVSSDDVTVIVDDGVATLTGEVGSWSERSKATENAYEGGATLVDNDLSVEMN